MKGWLRFGTIVADGIKNSTGFFWLLPMMYAGITSLSCFQICVPAFFFTCCTEVSCEVFHGPHWLDKRSGRLAFLSPVLFLNGCSKSAVCVCVSSVSKWFVLGQFYFTVAADDEEEMFMTTANLKKRNCEL